MSTCSSRSANDTLEDRVAMLERKVRELEAAS